MTTTKVHPQLTARFMVVTPALATEWLGKNRKNRNLRTKKAERYARDLKSGNWLATGDAIKFDWNGTLLDGQHRLTAILQSGTSAQMLVVRGLDPAVMNVLDTGAARTPADMLLLNGKQNTAVVAAVAKLCLNWQAGNIKTSASTLVLNPTHSEILAFVESDPTIQWAASRAQHFYGIGLSAKPSVVGFALWLTGNVDAAAANVFFTSLAEMTTDGAGDPRYALLRRLNSMKEERVTQVAQAWAIIRAWNAWRAGDHLGKIQSSGAGKSSVFPEPI